MGEKPIGQRDQKEKHDDPHQCSHGLPFLVGKILWGVHWNIPEPLLYARQQTTVNISTLEEMRVVGQYPPSKGASTRSATKCVGGQFHSFPGSPYRDQPFPKVTDILADLATPQSPGDIAKRAALWLEVLTRYGALPSGVNVSPRRDYPRGLDPLALTTKTLTMRALRRMAMVGHGSCG